MLQAAFAEDPAMLAWWATEIECVSALARLEREGALQAEGTEQALGRLGALALAWSEVDPVPPVRLVARRLLRVHPLRAADALRLAAALIAAEDNPSGLTFVTLDDRLADAARREGLPVIDDQHLRTAA